VVEGLTYGELKDSVYYDFLRLNAYIRTLCLREEKKDCCCGENNLSSSCLNEQEIGTIEEQIVELNLIYK
jgi:hypothetical protein